MVIDAGRTTDTDVRWMRRALEHARRGLGRTTPNPVVGACVITADGVVAGDGAHERAGEPHAEIYAIANAGDRARGATLYSTLEPCCHIGRTGPCTDRIIAAGIHRVVAAMEDPQPLVNGRGFQALRSHGIDVEVGVGRHDAVRLNQPYLTAVREHRPFVILKAATTLDGRLSAAVGERTQLTSDAAERHAHGLRAQVDAIGIGSSTLLVDDPLLTPRLVYRERPLTRVVFDRRLRASPDARLFSTRAAGPVIIITSRHAHRLDPERADALERAGATLIAVDDPTMPNALRRLADRDIQSLVLEGGPVVHQAAWDADVVDYVQLYIAPMMIGDGQTQSPDAVLLALGPNGSLASLIEPHVQMLGPDVLIEGYVHRPH